MNHPAVQLILGVTVLIAVLLWMAWPLFAKREKPQCSLCGGEMGHDRTTARHGGIKITKNVSLDIFDNDSYEERVTWKCVSCGNKEWKKGVG